LTNQTSSEQIITSIVSLLDSLKIIGVFNLFTPKEWLSDKEQPGRILAGLLYLQKYPQYVTPEIKYTLLDLQTHNKNKILSSYIEQVLKEAK